MTELGIAARAVHFVAVIALFGEFVFLTAAARPVIREAGSASHERWRELHRRLLRVASWSVVAALASGILWLAMQAADMSGMPLPRALDSGILRTVLAKTMFGRVWEMRLGIAAALIAVLLLGRRRTDDRVRLLFGVPGTLLSGVLLATLVWIGHAAAEQGADRYIHLLADAAHLLAAGAWLGALPPLVFVLTRARHGTDPDNIAFAARVTRRFSALGITSVGVLVATGLANAWYTVGSVPPLFGTEYGRLLLLKLALFATMVTLAAINRLRLTPELASALRRPPGESAVPALRQLRRNALAETALGLAIVAIVGALGITVPALHVQPVWPFSHTFSWDATEESPGLHIAVLAAGAAAFLALLSGFFGIRTRRQWLVIGSFAGFGVAVAFSAWLLTVPAYPSTYIRSPVRYTAASIARGIPLFKQNCVVCHGPYGHGDGPAAASLAVKPANLTEAHLFLHSEGNLFWWLQHGIPGTPMPGFGGRMSEPQIWDLTNFLRAQAESEDAKVLNDKVEPWRPIVAPDFPFQVDRRSQETLKEQRGRSVVLLVLYALPASLPRLRTLSESRQELARAGVRVVAVPMSDAAASREGKAQGVDPSIVADPDPDIAATYGLFRRSAAADPPPLASLHTEFLIDRQGYLRARWTLTPGQGWDPIPQLLRQIDILNHEKPRPPAPEGHVH